MRISVNHQFERRVGIFPAGFDADGVLFCNQKFGDFPIRIPDQRFDPWTEASTGRMTAGRLPFGGHFTVSGLRVLGHGNRVAPQAITVRATRVDDRTAHLEWDAVADAHGYNVRYGPHPEKLYHSWLVYQQTELDIRALNAGEPYWFAVDAFGEGGVTPGPVSS